MSAKERLVTILHCQQGKAQIIKGRLESECIPTLLSYESAGIVYGFTTNGLGEVKIMVPKHLVEQAKEILRISGKKSTKLQEQACSRPTWFKPLGLILLIIGIVAVLTLGVPC